MIGSGFSRLAHPANSCNNYLGEVRLYIDKIDVKYWFFCDVRNSYLKTMNVATENFFGSRSSEKQLREQNNE